VNIIVVGSGRAATELHIPHYQAIPDCHVVALCDPAIEWTRQVADRLGIPSVYESLDEALRKEKADAVSICSIPMNHLSDVKTALAHGCHVLLEKPAAMNLDEMRQMETAQQAAGRVLSVVHNCKFMPGVQQALEMIKQGLIGDVIHVQGKWMTVVGKDRMASEPDHWAHKLKGGRWAETLPHHVYILYQMVGRMEVKSVHAKQAGKGHDWLRPDEVEIVLEHEAGYAELLCSANMTVGYNDITVIGSESVLLCDYLRAGYIRHVDPPPTPRRVLRQNLELGKNLSLALLRRLGLAPMLSVWSGTGHEMVIRGFLDEIREGAPPLTSWEEAYHTMEIVDIIGTEIERQVEGMLPRLARD